MRSIQTQAETFAWRLAVRDINSVPFRANLPIEVAKHYSTFNPYEPEDGEDPKYLQERMKSHEDALKTTGFGGWDEGHDNYPVLSVGESGQHAVLNGHHRVWAADKLGMTHVPVDIYRGDDDDWAKSFGQPVEPHVANLLKGQP